MEYTGTENWRPTWNRVSPKELDDALALLTKYYDFISMDEAVEMISGDKPVKPYCMVITFDDGYRNNLIQALPILRKYNVPSTIYVCSGMTERREAYWIDRLDFALQSLNMKEVEVKVGHVVRTLDLSCRTSFTHSYKQLRLAIKSGFTDDTIMLIELDKAASQLERMSGQAIQDIIEDDPWCDLITKADLAALSDDVNIGSHTVNHIRVAYVDSDVLQKELDESKTYIEKHTRKKCEHFCYPNGDYFNGRETSFGFRDRHEPRILEQLKHSGYKSAVTVKPGVNRVGENLYLLKRISWPQAKSERALLYNLVRAYIC